MDLFGDGKRIVLPREGFKYFEIERPLSISTSFRSFGSASLLVFIEISSGILIVKSIEVIEFEGDQIGDRMPSIVKSPVDNKCLK